MNMKFPSLRLIISVFTFASACLLSTVSSAQSSFPQFEKTSCPSPFTTSGGKCSTNKPGYEGMINPNGKGSCPSGWTRSTNYCVKHTKEEKSVKSDKSDKISSKQVSDNPRSSDPDRTHFGKPVVKRINKLNELDFCPTGYFTSNARPIECITHMDDAPNVTTKKGQCPANTTEEQGQFCTGDTKLTYAQMDSAYTFDFNVQYLRRINKGLDTKDLDAVDAKIKPALYAQAKAAFKASASASASASTDAASDQPSANTENKNAEVKEAAKSIGTSLLKGLFKKEN